MRRGRILIFLILLVVIGLALLYFAFTQFSLPVTPTQAAFSEIYYAAQTIPNGTIITQEMLATFSIPPENVAEVMFTVGEESALVGHAARYTLDLGVVITTPMIEATTSAASGVSLQDAFHLVDQQHQAFMKGNIAYTVPKTMNTDEQVIFELILNPTLSQEELVTQIATLSGLPTSTAAPGTLVTGQGGELDIVGKQIEITDRMKAELKPSDSTAFNIVSLHDSAEQLIRSKEITQWNWSLTAKKVGAQKLTLVIYRLVKYDDQEYWHAVETYNAEITVKVTASSWLRSLDWKWVIATLLIPLGAGLWAWWKNRNKKPDVLQVQIVKEKKDWKRKKEK